MVYPQRAGLYHPHAGLQPHCVETEPNFRVMRLGKFRFKLARRKDAGLRRDLA